VAVETALAGYPGFFATAPPGPGSAASVFWPILLPAADLPQLVGLGDRTWTVPPPAADGTKVDGRVRADPENERRVRCFPSSESAVRSDTGTTARVPLGRLVGARSGDKGGNATLGLWARDDDAYAWLSAWWDDVHVAWLLGEDAAGCPLRLWALPELRAVGVTVVGFLGRGVADNLALDPQAKGLGEFVRARHVEVPEELLR
jgi:hypothetical protein